MRERFHGMTDEQLGAALGSLDLDWPPSPDLTPAVMTAARSLPPRVTRLPLSRPRRILLIAAATILLLAGVAVAAKVLIDLGAVVVEVTPGPPGALPSPPRIPLGRPITLEEAEDLLGDEVALPTRLGPPERIWADEVITEEGDVVRLTAAWRPAPALPAIAGSSYGMVLIRFEGDTDQASKEVYADTGSVEPARIGDILGMWTVGLHELELLTSEGVVVVRVDGNVLLWRDGPYTVRLETSLPKRTAVRLAASIPSGTS
jgi:hypothetical protein